MIESGVRWSTRERKCLSLLQLKGHRTTTLLQIHAFMLVNALHDNLNLLTKLITTFSAANPHCGTAHARRLFDQMPHRSDAFLCNTMIKSHCSSRQFSVAVRLYAHLRREEGFVPDNYTFTTLPKCCGLDFLMREGMEVHAHVVRYGFNSNTYVTTALVDMYGKLGQMDFARKVFDEMIERSPVSWTALINGYIRGGDMDIAKAIFDGMPETQKDTAGFNVMLDGYVKLGEMRSAKMLFDAMPEKNVVSWTTMIDGYCSNGGVDDARLLFDMMPNRNLYSWNAMIGGYCHNKRPHEALVLFEQLLAQKLFELDDVTVVSILPAITDLGALDLGNWVYKLVKKKKLDRSANVSTALVDMYGKCGEIEKARRVFDEVEARETCTWNALINGLALNGCAKEALEVFVEMKREGFNPNDITMLGVLSACNHGGLVEEGKRWFSKMAAFRLTPKIEHYGCLIDLLGRAGHLEEAERLMKSMPYEANGIILSSFVFACGYAKDVSKAEKVVEKAITADPCNDGNYIMLRNLYATERRWRDVERIKRKMVIGGAKKEVGCSAIEINNHVLEFIAGDKKLPHLEATHLVLDQLQMHIKLQEPFFNMDAILYT
ncbi:pentatricopeptide repeat-containing protein At2g44880 [Salvia miltiorrhiza]|uniref:Pentatricopeptide repeat protein n=1 Tax=Salvia miltiorrhiza TaxID=226208 RepID=A0A678WDR5_SALMI|nr:pentatricopeptide repeat-containing protein At2g44880 [Salvia miltiorrhiza]AYM00770.1 pentatricopeptide repeat protein [Salvia miltiorrhiza]